MEYQVVSLFMMSNFGRMDVIDPGSAKHEHNAGTSKKTGKPYEISESGFSMLRIAINGEAALRAGIDFHARRALAYPGTVCFADLETRLVSRRVEGAESLELQLISVRSFRVINLGTGELVLSSAQTPAKSGKAA